MCVPHTDKERVCLSLLLDILAIMTYYPHQFRLLIITSPLPRSNYPAQPDLADLLVWLITLYCRIRGREEEVFRGCSVYPSMEKLETQAYSRLDRGFTVTKSMVATLAFAIGSHQPVIPVR